LPPSLEKLISEMAGSFSSALTLTSSERICGWVSTSCSSNRLPSARGSERLPFIGFFRI
jgi:hypothetical protein